jgi:hypothetical protein
VRFEPCATFEPATFDAGARDAVDDGGCGRCGWLEDDHDAEACAPPAARLDDEAEVDEAAVDQDGAGGYPVAA